MSCACEFRSVPALPDSGEMGPLPTSLERSQAPLGIPGWAREHRPWVWEPPTVHIQGEDLPVCADHRLGMDSLTVYGEPKVVISRTSAAVAAVLGALALIAVTVGMPAIEASSLAVVDRAHLGALTGTISVFLGFIAAMAALSTVRWEPMSTVEIADPELAHLITTAWRLWLRDDEETKAWRAAVGDIPADTFDLARRHAQGTLDRPLIDACTRRLVESSPIPLTPAPTGALRSATSA